jgi:hypothetical protein
VPGTIVCTFRATDDDGDSESVSTTVTIRPQPNMKPTISITSPKNGSEVSGIVTITGYASDDTGVAKVEIKIDGGVYVTVQGTTAWKYDWNAKGLAGNHLITAKATDISGASTEVSINISVTQLVGTVPTKTGSQGIPPSMLLLILIIVVLLCAFIAYKYSAPRKPVPERELPKETEKSKKEETEKENEKKEDKKEK